MAIHDLVELGKDRGYITQDELDGVLPAEGTNRRAMVGLIEDMDIEVLDGEAEVDLRKTRSKRMGKVKLPPEASTSTMPKALTAGILSRFIFAR